MKKTLSLILALLMTLSCASFVFADDAAIDAVAAVDEEMSVEDESTPYDLAIEFLTMKNIMHGKGDGLHAADAVKRYEMALFIGRITTGWVKDDTWEDFDANDSGFSDLKGTGAENVYGAMSYVSQKGYIVGYPDGSFKPEKTVTYREALTMAVRALGFDGLKYPWGYIEKAVEFGLTEEITDVAYTDEITRGVAAQIIYNALFALDSKLALKNFDCAYGWANIMITSTMVDDHVVTAFTDGKYNTKNGYVAFQILNKDGTLDKNVYYVAREELGLQNGHDDEIALGTPYTALFEIDKDDDLVNLISAYPYEATTTWNLGKTDDAGKAIDGNAIKSVLAGYTLVDKYTKKVLSNKGLVGLNELILKRVGTRDKTDFNYLNNPYAFDWNNGNILKKNAQGKYEVAYYYNAQFDYYFRIHETVAGKDVGIDILDEADIAAIKAEIASAIVSTTSSTIMTSVDPALWSVLNIYDVDGKPYGTYEEFKFGWLMEVTDGWGCKDHKRNCLAFNGGGFAFAPSSACEHQDEAWWQPQFAPVMDGAKVASNLVVMSWNDITKELKVIKTLLAKGSSKDADSYYDFGTLTGVSLKNKYAIIDGVKYNFSDVNLWVNTIWVGNAPSYAGYKADSWTTLETLTTEFDKLFNQYVKFYLLDGEICAIEASGKWGNEHYIVVENYAGISSDGYIVVNGYSTNDLTLKQYKIASFDGWDEGSFKWYADQIKDEFKKGNVYKVLSTNQDGALGVTTAARYDFEDHAWTYEEGGLATFTFADGYRFINDKAPKKMQDSDKYILIGSASDKNNYMPIVVYEGKILSEQTEITGNVIKGGDNKCPIVVVNATIKGSSLDLADSYKAGIVAVLQRTILERFYDDAHEVISNDWYLRGATEYSDVLVFDFLSGDVHKAVSMTNKKISKGNVYRTIDGVIVDGTSYGRYFMNAWEEMKDAYDVEVVNKMYKFFELVPLKADYLGNNDKAKNAFSYDFVSKNVFKFSKQYEGLVNSIKVFAFDANGEVSTIREAKADDFKNGAYGYVVVKMSGEKVDVVCYIDLSAKDTAGTSSKIDGMLTDNAIDVSGKNTSAIVGFVNGTKEVPGHNYLNDPKDAIFTINSVGFKYIGVRTLLNHAEIRDNVDYFDVKGLCDVTAWHSTIKVDGADAKAVKAADITYGLYDDTKEHVDCYENGKCELISDFVIDLKNTTGALTLKEGETRYVKFESSKIKGNENWTLTIKLTVENGVLTATLNDDVNVADYYGAANLILVKDVVTK